MTFCYFSCLGKYCFYPRLWQLSACQRSLSALTQPQSFDSSKLSSALCKQTIADAWWFLWPVKAEIWTSPYNRYSMVWKLWTHIAAVLPLAIRVLEPVQDLPIFSFSVKNISPKNKRGCQLDFGRFFLGRLMTCWGLVKVRGIFLAIYIQNRQSNIATKATADVKSLYLNFDKL